MAFAILFALTIVLAVLAANWSVIRKTYFGRDGARNTLALLLALISAALTAVTLFSLRWLYLPDPDETPHWWRAFQGLDAFLVTFFFVFTGALFFYFKSWYRRSPLRRFGSVALLQVFITGAAGLARMSMTGGDPRSTSVWAAIALAGLAVFVLFVVRHGRLLIQDLREFGKSLDD
jgi:hypothetical protein